MQSIEKMTKIKNIFESGFYKARSISAVKQYVKRKKEAEAPFSIQP